VFCALSFTRVQKKAKKDKAGVETADKAKDGKVGGAVHASCASTFGSLVTVSSHCAHVPSFVLWQKKKAKEGGKEDKDDPEIVLIAKAAVAKIGKEARKMAGRLQDLEELEGKRQRVLAAWHAAMLAFQKLRQGK
jgi:hypothetical protein